MARSLRAVAIAIVIAIVASAPLMAQTTGSIPPPAPPSQLPPPTANQYSSNEIIDAGHRFFGGVSRDLAGIIEKAVSKWGLPNGYILGEEASGAFIGGLRYGDGTLYTRNAGDVRVFWEGPSFGFDFGADGARTMMLVYSLPQTGAIFSRFGGINGSAYLVGGLGMTALTRKQYGGGANPLRDRPATWSQSRLAKVHRQSHLESFLINNLCCCRYPLWVISGHSWSFA